MATRKKVVERLSAHTGELRKFKDFTPVQQRRIALAAIARSASTVPVGGQFATLMEKLDGPWQGGLISLVKGGLSIALMSGKTVFFQSSRASMMGKNQLEFLVSAGLLEITDSGNYLRTTKSWTSGKTVMIGAPSLSKDDDANAKGANWYMAIAEQGLLRTIFSRMHRQELRIEGESALRKVLGGSVQEPVAPSIEDVVVVEEYTTPVTPKHEAVRRVPAPTPQSTSHIFRLPRLPEGLKGFFQLAIPGGCTVVEWDNT